MLSGGRGPALCIYQRAAVSRHPRPPRGLHHRSGNPSARRICVDGRFGAGGNPDDPACAVFRPISFRQRGESAGAIARGGARFGGARDTAIYTGQLRADTDGFDLPARAMENGTSGSAGFVPSCRESRSLPVPSYAGQAVFLLGFAGFPRRQFRLCCRRGTWIHIPSRYRGQPKRPINNHALELNVAKFCIDGVLSWASRRIFR